MRSRITILLVLALAAAAQGCTSFATVRSARVQPGGELTVQGLVSSPTGDGAGWFWALYCAQDCGRSVVGFDLSYTHGWTGDRPYTLGVGLNGVPFPFVEGYTQLNRDTARAYGVGVRIAPPFLGWGTYQLYGRYDLPLSDSTRLLLNPGAYLFAGHSPNGENPGHFLAFVQGVGWEYRGERMTFIPSVALVAGRGDRRSYGVREGPFTAVFGVTSVSFTYGRGRSSSR